MLQKLLMQQNEEHIGIFLQQQSESPVECSFSLAVLQEDYQPVRAFSGNNTFVGRSRQQSTSGWLFPSSSLAEMLEKRDELLVEADLTVYTSDTSCVSYLFQMLSIATLPNWLQHAVISGVQECVEDCVEGCGPHHVGASAASPSVVRGFRACVLCGL